MKKKILSMLLALTMIVSLVAVTAISASADSENLQVCTDIVEVNGEGHESTSQLTADAWFEQTYGGIITDTDGTVSTFRVRGWANPLDGSDLLQFGYSLESDEIHWDDALMAPEAGLHSYFAKAERFDVTVNFDYLPVGDYEFHLYAKTSTGIYEVEEEAFVLEKQAETAVHTFTATFKADGQVVGTVTFEEGAKSITAPDVPAKAGFTGAWESYTLANENIEINAVYTEIPAEETTAAEGETTAAEGETTVAEGETTVAEEETTVPDCVETTTGADIGTETEPGDTAVVGDVTTVAEAAATTVADAETTGKGGKSGCGGIVSVSALAIVALFGGAIVIKKRNG